jgi:GNAT superfamily N-acetyltransferase
LGRQTVGLSAGGSATARRIGSILRWEGLHGVASRALARLGWRSFGIWARPLDEPVPPVGPTLPIEVQALGAGDAALYREFRPDSAAELDRRLRAGHACFVAVSAGRVVAVTWVAVGPVKVPYLEREIVPGPGELYLFDIYVAPDQRGARLAPRIFATIAELHRAQGYRRALCLIALYNRSSIRSHERLGFRRVGSIHAIAGGTIRTADVPSMIRASPGAGEARARS